MNYKQLLAMSPEDLLNYLVDNFYLPVPDSINTSVDMENASRQLLALSSYYSFLCNLSSFAKLATRDAKRNKEKIEYEDMVDKKEIIQNMTESIKQQYSALSRAVTIRIENNRELKMSQY